MDLKKAQEYIKALKNGEKFPKKNMFLIMFLLGALLFVIVLPTGSSAPTSEKGGLDENKRKENKNENIIYTPCKGTVVPITEVPDPVFSEKVLGDGFAVIPAEGKIYAPTDGEVTLVFDTLHAVGMTSSMGTEVLIHIGLDTVTLGGEPFTAHVAAGDKVKKGDLLVEVDLDKIKAAGLNSITPVLISNTDTYDKISLQKEGDVLFDEAVLKIL